MAAPAQIRQQQRRPAQRAKVIRRPEWAYETIENPKGGFTKFPNQELDHILISELDGIELRIVLYLTRHTRGGCFEGQEDSGTGRERKRPRVIGPRPMKWDDDQGTGIRHRLAADLRAKVETIDKGLQQLRKLGIVELKDDDTPGQEHLKWLIFRPENLTNAPEREIVEKTETSTDDPEGKDDSAGERRASLPAVNIGAHTRSKWYNLGETKIRFDNRDRSAIAAGLEIEDEGITVVIEESPPAAAAPEAAHKAGENGNGRKTLRPDKSQTAENGHVAEARMHVPPHFANLSAASKAAFDALLAVFDRCGKPVPVDRPEKIHLCKRHFTAYTEKEHLRIVADACAREGHEWDKRQFTPTMWAYLDPLGKQLWDNEPVKPRTSNEGAPAKKKTTDWDAVIREAAAEKRDPRLPGVKR